jgi:hypothetical protein
MCVGDIEMVASQNLTGEGCFIVETVKTLVDILHNRALHQPEKKAFTFLVDGETQESPPICKR